MRQVLEQNNYIESRAKIKNTVAFITEIFVQTSEKSPGLHIKHHKTYQGGNLKRENFQLLIKNIYFWVVTAFIKKPPTLFFLSFLQNVQK